MFVRLTQDRLTQLINCHVKSTTERGTLLKVLNEEGDSHRSEPGPFSEDVNELEKGEKAYQRAILGAWRVALPGVGNVKWLDIELPVVFGETGRRTSIDLIGRTAEDVLLLCELKYAKPEAKHTSKSDSPVYALLELLIYFRHILCNAKELQDHDIRHTNHLGSWDWERCSDPENVALVMAANKTYWDRWKNRNWEKKICCKVLSIRRDIGLPLRIRFFSTPEADPPFREQAREAKETRYKPAPLIGEWTEELI